jgi:uncharacterized protein YceH (UPF0502 family)
MEAPQPTGSSPSEAAPRKWQVLSSRQRRVFGVLIEKAKTTPDAYPLTVNALVSGSNQKNNREPQTSYTPEEVEQALEELRAIGAVTEVQGSGRVPKYRHHAYEWLGVEKTELAVMAELLLRGEQTLGELRGRAARMEPIADTAALKPVVDGLLKKGLMIELTGPGRGQIVSHNLYKEREINELKARFAGYVPPASTVGEDDAPTGGLIGTAGAAIATKVANTGMPVPVGPTKDEFAELEVEVAELRAEMARVRETLTRLEGKLDSLMS